MKLFTYVTSLVVVVAFVFSAALLPQNAEAKSRGFSIGDIIELLISLDIISDDKADLARELAEERGFMDDEDDEDEDEDDDEDDNNKYKNKNKYTYNKCPYGQFKKGLYLGTTGDDVTVLQKFLAQDKSIYPEGKVTGYFGPLTEKAVKKYQKKYGIEQVGIVGPKTRAKMNANCIIYKKGYEDMYKDDDEDDDDDDTDELERITLEADEDSEKVRWESDGKSPKGYMVVWSLDEDPEYPVDDDDKDDVKSSYSSNKGDGYKKVTPFNGTGTYYVQVCEYLGSKECGLYSNQVEIKLVDEDDEDEVTEITLHADQENEKVWWETEGISEDGFKVLWATTTGPEYPTRDGDEYRYLDDSEADEAEDLEAFDGTGTYFVRVCEYLADDSECGVYSNEVTLDLEEETQS